MDILQESNLKEGGTACPNVPKNESVRKMTDLVEHGAFAGAQDTKEAASPLDRGAGNSGNI